ncbi:MAG TPA: hypothetical protein VMM78_09485 [Thermomicrobiales bacterium]|nr:hypothetical protein [Thermomicrobiales bacterium]
MIGLWLVLAVLLAASSSARAEDRPEPATRQIGGSAEWSSLVEGWGGMGSYRRWSGAVGVEVGAARWTGESHIEYPGGTISDLGSASGFSAGASALIRGRAGRFVAIAGTGPALFRTRIVTRTTFSGVERSTTRVTSSGVGLRLLLEFEAAVTRRVSGFVGARAELPDLRHPGVGAGALSAGVRLGW